MVFLFLKQATHALFKMCKHLYMQLYIYTRNKAATISLSLVDMFGGLEISSNIWF
ncbi:unnamed protein product [Prunus brigantina]